MSKDSEDRSRDTIENGQNTVRLLLAEYEKVGKYHEALEQRLDNFAGLYLTIVTFTLGGASLLYQSLGLDTYLLAGLAFVLLGLLAIGFTFMRRIILVHVHRHRIAVQIQTIWKYFMMHDPNAAHYFERTDPIPYPFPGAAGGLAPLAVVEAWNSTLVASLTCVVLVVVLTTLGQALDLARLVCVLLLFVIVWAVAFRFLQRYESTLQRTAQAWMRLNQLSATSRGESDLTDSEKMP